MTYAVFRSDVAPREVDKLAALACGGSTKCGVCELVDGIHVLRDSTGGWAEAASVSESHDLPMADPLQLGWEEQCTKSGSWPQHVT